jgi:hypothetical protein
MECSGITSRVLESWEKCFLKVNVLYQKISYQAIFDSKKKQNSRNATGGRMYIRDIFVPADPGTPASRDKQNPAAAAQAFNPQ